MLEKDLEIKSTDKQRRKLVDYFNQWWEEKFKEKWHFKYTMRFDEVHLVSKKMWFISWLLKNDKIEINKVKSRMLQVFELRFQEYATYENVLLMLLSISDNPISDLISYLK